VVTVNLAKVRRGVRHAEDATQRVLAMAGFRQSETRVSADAQTYWSQQGNARWQSDSHWRGGSAFTDNNLWPEIGRRHLKAFERGARTVGFDRPWSRVVEWGCGGGANAIHFAPRAQEIVGVDISAETLAECGREVSSATDALWRPVRITVADPESALDSVARCDVWLSFYVFELIPGPENGERLLKIAHQMLVPGGSRSSRSSTTTAAGRAGRGGGRTDRAWPR
jgi:cyclopropane fatty-acyl-phospholipid synthase-like methyltransferase